ncbi:MAG TPA: glycosyltransferase [Opitutus sp.]|nr:glycosyltransferase [Opitutus sp.]
MNLAISAPMRSPASETFVQAQFGGLPCKLRVHGTPIARETLPGGPLAPLRHFLALTRPNTLLALRARFKTTAGWAEKLPLVFAELRARALRLRLRRAGIDVFLANFGPAAVSLLPVCRDLRIPLVAHFHGADAHALQLLARYADGYRLLGREAAAIVVVSEIMRRQLQQLGVPPEKIHLVRCGANASLFSQPALRPASPVFIAIGRMVEKKAPHLTLLAFKLVHDRLPDARLILAGDGELFESTRNLAAALGIAAAVEFLGAVPHAEVARRMSGATCFVQHSIVPMTGPHAGDHEGTPVVLLEAMLAGLPVVVTRHAGMGEVIEHERTGVLVEERDVAAMSAAMIRIATDEVWAARLGSAARRQALAQHTHEQYLGALRHLLESVVIAPRNARTAPALSMDRS